MKLCAIVLDYRGASKTEACLSSLCGQGVDTVLVVDNSDNIDASAALAGVINRLESTGIDYHLHLLNPETNLGFARGVNLAIAHPVSQHCELLLLLNNDATLSPEAVPLMKAALERGEADAVTPAVVDDEGKPQLQLWYQRFWGLQTSKQIAGSFPYLSGCCLLLTRNLAPSGKLFDEDFFMYGEDVLLGWRLLREKKRTKTVETAIARHTGQGTWPDCNLFYEYQLARAHVVLAKKTWRSPFERPLLLLTKAIGLLVRALRRSIHYRNGVPLRAFILAWRRLDIRKNP